MKGDEIICCCLVTFVGTLALNQLRAKVHADEQLMPTSESPSKSNRSYRFYSMLRQLLQNISDNIERDESDLPAQFTNVSHLKQKQSIERNLGLLCLLVRSHNRSQNRKSLDLSSLLQAGGSNSRSAVIITAYSIIVVVSMFGNCLVCNVVWRNRRLHTVTNLFIANLAISDVLMTVLNIPFNVGRILLNDWPFGAMMCHIVPYVQVCSVYVSSFTMVAIAFDRYWVIVRPLQPRIRLSHGWLILVFVWLLAAAAAVPHAMYNQVVSVFTFRRLTRCQSRYPAPARNYRKWLTLVTSISQYCAPLTVTCVVYVAVVRKLWSRALPGVASARMLVQQTHSRRSSIKMLVTVVLVFAVCWLPLNLYHLVVDFSLITGPRRHNSSIFFFCHWFAMSNVCYNPFIYCWLNEHFRAGALSWLHKAACRSSNALSALEINGVLIRNRHRFNSRSKVTELASASSAASGLQHSCSEKRRFPESGQHEELTLKGVLEVKDPKMLKSLLSKVNIERASDRAETDIDMSENEYKPLPGTSKSKSIQGYRINSDKFSANFDIIYGKRKRNANLTVRNLESSMHGSRNISNRSSDEHVKIEIFQENSIPDRASCETYNEEIYKAKLTGSFSRVSNPKRMMVRSVCLTAVDNENQESIELTEHTRIHHRRQLSVSSHQQT